MSRVPDALVRDIQEGNCIAFVGAGFSAAVIPAWGQLLTELATNSGALPAIQAHIGRLVDRASAHALDEAAQTLEDQLGPDDFLEELRKILTRRDGSAMTQRLEWLRGIPFRSILTTNFDPLLPGATPGADAYRRILRPDEYRWWESRYWGEAKGAETLKLHGDVEKRQIVLTREDYRRRLYGDPAYITFLRTMIATTTVLYMGFSFEDAYLNEVRSEILALLNQGDRSAPVAYAIVNDVPPETRAHFRKHEGVEILSYETRETPDGKDFSGFDDYLESLYRATNPLVRFGNHLAKQRLLWVDPHPENNEEAFGRMESAAALAGGKRSALVKVATADEGIAELDRARGAGEPFDLTITHWGDGAATAPDGTPCPAAVKLLSAIRSRDLRCPVIVFGGARNAAARKREALRLGALAYHFDFRALYQTIEETLSP